MNDNKLIMSVLLASILMGCIGAQRFKKVEFPDTLSEFIASSKALSSDVNYYYKYSNDSISITFRYDDQELTPELVEIHVNAILMNLLEHDSPISAMNFTLKGKNDRSEYRVVLDSQIISEIHSSVIAMKSYTSSVNYLVENLDSRDAGYLSGAVDALNEHFEKFNYQGNGVSFLLEFAEDCRRGKLDKCLYAHEMEKLFRGTKENVLLETVEYFNKSCRCPPSPPNDKANNGRR